jgi:SAM-dependent methyltransferase
MSENNDIKELLLGCGNSREKKLFAPENNRDWHNLTTLDWSPDCKPDVVHDLTVLPYPFADNEFDECHLYECLEHTGQQGNWRFFFDQFSELWRITKPGGMLFGTCPLPNSPWAWADPSHTRVIALESFIFLRQQAYEQHVGKTAMTDFRHYYKADWELVFEHKDVATQMFALKAIKPAGAAPEITAAEAAQ